MVPKKEYRGVPNQVWNHPCPYDWLFQLPRVLQWSLLLQSIEINKRLLIKHNNNNTLCVLLIFDSHNHIKVAMNIIFDIDRDSMTITNGK